MKSKNNQQITVSDSQKSAEQVNKSRRSFAKVGAIVAPVIMTLANRSAWATDTCSQSGFTSFSNANHAVSNVANVKNTNWKTPSAWSTVGTWPTGFGKATYSTSSTKFMSGLWSGNKTLDEVKLFETGNNVKVLASSVISSVLSSSTVTLVAALTDTGNQLLAYQVATVLNNAVVVGGVQQKVPAYFLSGQATLAEFQTFYSNCV